MNEKNQSLSESTVKPFRIKKSDWHYKLQKFVFGKVPNYTSGCPYAWMTLFCIFAVLIVAPIKMLILALVWLFKTLFKGIEEIIFKPRFIKWVERLDDEELFKLQDFRNYYNLHIPTLLFSNYSDESIIEICLKKRGVDMESDEYKKIIENGKQLFREKKEENLKLEQEEATKYWEKQAQKEKRINERKEKRFESSEALKTF